MGGEASLKELDELKNYQTHFWLIKEDKVSGKLNLK